MSDSWISENERNMDMADKWVSHAESKGIQEEWFDLYDDEEPQVKNINVWIQIDADTSMTVKEIKEEFFAKLEKLEWEAE